MQVEITILYFISHYETTCSRTPKMLICHQRKLNLRDEEAPGYVDVQLPEQLTLATGINHYYL